MLEHHARGRTTLFILVLTLVLTALSKRAAGDDATLDASQDNTLYEISDGSLSNGAGKHLFAGRTGQGTGLDRRRGLLLFDIAASIPAGSTINTVTLRLSMSKTQAPTTSVSVHRLLAQWGEGASDASGSEGAGEDAEAGDATWTYTFYPSESWTTPGGDFAANASASTNVGSEGFYEWSGEALVDDVQAWLDDPGSNAGWILIGNESTSSTAKRFDTHENNDESVHPALIVDYTTALPSGACCLTDGECIVLPSAECVDAGGAYEGDDAPCAAGTCPPAGACCLAGDTCDRLTDAACTNQGGTYLGDETTCDGNPCLPDLGACCFSGAVCLEITPADCTAQDGTYPGNATTCVAKPCPLALTHFVDALPRPAVAQPVSGAPGGAAHYEIAMTQFEQQLHADLQPTTVWGYGGTYPGPTIEARVDELVTVEWINDLRNADGTLRTDHYLEVDLCPHGAADLPKTVVHLHGGHVEQHSDGYPEDTFLPGSSSEIYEYPNHQTPGTIWYHDHGLGITRLNVYMGLAGFYLIRDDVEDGLGLPSGEYEIPLAIQDRSFNLDGSWAYPAVWQDHFFGDTILVNGKVWPYLEVDRGMYRFRVLNGSNSRVYTLALSNGATFVQIGGDGGLLEAPVEHTELTITGGERADLVMDFSAYPPGTEIILTNSAPAPYPGSPGVGVI
ncbi:MAG: DNRLRE domain-containing protein, partial [Planctomycetota bacterium]